MHINLHAMPCKQCPSKDAIPTELVSSRSASATQQLGAEISFLVAPNLPSKAAVDSTHEDCAAFADLYSALRNLMLSAWCLAAVTVVM